MDRSFRTPSRTLSRSSSLTDRSQSTLGYVEVMNTNISVVARFRPLIETPQAGQSLLQDHTDTQCQVKTGETVSDFTFDRVFGPEATQRDVFEYCKSTVQDVLLGFNGTILAYGQSGAGKTTTLMGPDVKSESRGLIPRIVDHIWDSKSIDHKCSVAYFEIYKERVKDLLDPLKDNLSVHESSASSGFYVKNLTWDQVETAQQVYDKMNQGNINRAVASTNCNSQSSRSHSLFAIQISCGSQKGLLYLVDLAGSEKVSKTRATGNVLEEAKSINRSLSTLGMVINALTDPKIGHIPYRDSKLTRILQESLGGNSRTTLIIHCAPHISNANETLSTLRFGTRAKAVRNRPIVNVDASAVKYELLKQELLKWRSGVEVPLADRVDIDQGCRPSSALSCLSSLSNHERRRSLTSPRQINDRSSILESPGGFHKQRHTLLEEKEESLQVDISVASVHIQASTEVLRIQNGILQSHNDRILQSTTCADSQSRALEKELARVEAELALQAKKVQSCMDELGSRVTVLNIY